jgi:hypothetical protein
MANTMLIIIAALGCMLFLCCAVGAYLYSTSSAPSPDSGSPGPGSPGPGSPGPAPSPDTSSPPSGSPPSGSPPSGSPPSDSPPSGSPPSGSPPSGSPIAGSPASDSSRPASSNYKILFSGASCMSTTQQYSALKTTCKIIVPGFDTMGLNSSGCWKCLKMDPTGLHPGTEFSLRYADTNTSLPPAVCPSDLSTLSSLLSCATVLKTASTDLGTTKITPDNLPVVTVGTNPVWSLSMWITLPHGTPPTGAWLTVLGFAGTYLSLTPQGNNPLVWVLNLQTAQSQTPTTSGPQPSNWVPIYNFRPWQTYHIGIVAYQNLTYQIYRNGVNITTTGATSVAPAQVAFNTNGSDAAFNYNNSPMSGISVKNVYFFNKVLNDQHMALLGTTPAGSGTTSGYMPEPYTKY